MTTLNDHQRRESSKTDAAIICVFLMDKKLYWSELGADGKTWGSPAVLLQDTKKYGDVLAGLSVTAAEIKDNDLYSACVVAHTTTGTVMTMIDSYYGTKEVTVVWVALVPGTGAGMGLPRWWDGALSINDGKSSLYLRYSDIKPPPMYDVTDQLKGAQSVLAAFENRSGFFVVVRSHDNSVSMWNFGVMNAKVYAVPIPLAFPVNEAVKVLDVRMRQVWDPDLFLQNQWELYILDDTGRTWVIRQDPNHPYNEDISGLYQPVFLPAVAVDYGVARLSVPLWSDNAFHRSDKSSDMSEVLLFHVHSDDPHLWYGAQDPDTGMWGRLRSREERNPGAELTEDQVHEPQRHRR